MPEQDNLIYYNQQLEFGTQLIDYDRRRKNAKKFFDEGKMTEEEYNDFLFRCNDEERIQQTKIDNYKSAIEGYSDRDKINYNFYHLLINGKWDDASKFYTPTKAGFDTGSVPFNIPYGQMDKAYYPNGFGEIVKNYNKLFTVNGQTQNSRTINFNQWYFNELNKYITDRDMNLTQYDIVLDESSRTVTIPHEEKAFMILSKIIGSITKENPFETMVHNVGDGGYLNKTGGTLIEFENRYKKFTSKYQNPIVDDVPIHSSLDYIDTFAFVEDGQIKTANGLGSFQEMQAYMDRVNYGIKAGETKFNKEEIQNTFYRQLAGTSAANFPVWTINGNEFKRETVEGGEYEPNTNDTHREQILQDIAYAMENQPNAIFIRPAEDGENYGHIIYIPARENKDGSKQVHPGYKVFVNNFFEKEAIAAYRNDLGVIARDEIKTMEGYHMPKLKRSIRLQGSNSQGTYQIGSDLNGNYVYLYNNSNGKQFNLNQIFGSSQAAKAALWQVITAQNKLNTYTNLGVITEQWFDSLMTEYNNASGATTEEILSILGEQSVDETRKNVRTAYKIKNKFQQ